ncbi:GlxA family transcriptional regulator [Thiosulfatihalobacter marinus]|uniref:GlxA family transcriptional regulator n=1 Tax=Thiosulfatihalobacter marinus TaxID=2792481 RepID=UPI0018D9DE65|nr:helix-turn-helix domain-containing protein [Thiosulfatihalobacter marinus]
MAQAGETKGPEIATTSVKPMVAVLVCDGFAPFQFSVPCAIFGNFLPGLDLFDMRICAVEPQPLHNEFGMSIVPTGGTETIETADVIVIPFWNSPDKLPSEDLVNALRRADDNGAKLVGLCLGGYVLAYAGLLDHRRASTHWEVVEDFRTRFPKVRLNDAALFVEDGNLMTSAGTGAGIDCCLEIVRSYYGSDISNRVAQRLVIPYCRDGSQAQFIQTPAMSNSDSLRLERTIAYLTEHLAGTHDVDSLAARSGMSRRSFTRNFRKMTGTSLGSWLTGQRLQKALLLLETTDTHIESIATLIGFPSSAAFRRHFLARCGLTPSNWRKQHGQPVRKLF